MMGRDPGRGVAAVATAGALAFAAWVGAPTAGAASACRERLTDWQRAGQALAVAPAGFAITPCLHRVGLESFEPSLGITKSGAIVVFPAFEGSAPPGGGFPDQPATDQRLRGPAGVAVSADRGQTWRRVRIQQAGIDLHPIAGDPYAYVDPVTSRVFATNSYLPSCGRVSQSDDDGATWTSALVNCGLADQQKVFAGPPVTSRPDAYPNVVYYCAISGGALPETSTGTTCTKSLDGGRTFAATGSPAYQNEPGRECGGWTGLSRVARDGTVYVPRGWCDEPYLAISRDEGESWRRVRVPGRPLVPDTHGASVATDDAGTVYYAWIADDRQPYLAASRDRGVTWNGPTRVSPREVREANFVAVDAAGDGSGVALSYLGSTDSPGPPFPAGASAAKTWNGYISWTPEATAPAPAFLSAAVNESGDPLLRGGCRPDFCADSVYDFIDLRIDATGVPWASFLDACQSACKAGGSNDAREAVVGTLEISPAPSAPMTLRVRVRPRRVRVERRTRFTFRVADASNVPVPGAAVRFAGRRAWTDRNGRARLKLRLHRPGRVRVRVLRVGYRPAETTVRALRRAGSGRH